MTTPDQQWWTINGAELLAALHRVAAGDDPDVAYTELWANSEIEDLSGPAEAMTTPDHTALRAIAEAATPGPWWHDGDGEVSVNGDLISHPTHAADAAYIATFDPPTVLALLDTLAAVEAVRDHYADLTGTVADEAIAADVADRLDAALGGGES